jgi:hypothetical protein
MTSTTIKATLSEVKRQAFELRQTDTGWGRVLAQSWVPFYGFYYAISRRSITPWLWACVVTAPAVFCVGMYFADNSKKDLDALQNMASLVVAPFGFKVGTDKARDYAKKRLEEG